MKNKGARVCSFVNYVKSLKVQKLCNMKLIDDNHTFDLRVKTFQDLAITKNIFKVLIIESPKPKCNKSSKWYFNEQWNICIDTITYYVMYFNMLINYCCSYERATPCNNLEGQSWPVSVLTKSYIQQHMLKLLFSFIRREPTMLASLCGVMVPLIIMIVSMTGTQSQVIQAGINWWSNPKAWEQSVDSSGYLKERAIPLIMKLADELSRRSKANGDTSSENKMMLLATCVILGVVGSAAFGYIIKNQKDKKKAEVEKSQRVAQLNQLMLWKQETLARQGFGGAHAAAQVMYDQRNEVP